MRRRGVADPCVLLLVADDLRDIGTRLLRAFEGAQHRCAGRASPNDTHAYHRVGDSGGRIKNFHLELAFDVMKQKQGGHGISLSGPQTSRTPAIFIFT